MHTSVQGKPQKFLPQVSHAPNLICLCSLILLHIHKVNIPYIFHIKRPDQVIISFCIGHSKLIHTFLLNLVKRKQQHAYGCICFIVHIFLECPNTLPVMYLLLIIVQSIQNLFTKVKIQVILKFQQESDLCKTCTCFTYVTLTHNSSYI